MTRSMPVMTRITPELKEKLRALAKDTNRSEAYLAAEAIAEYVEMNAWQIAEIKRRLRKAKAGSPGIPHEDVEAWVKSWGGRRERPRPKPRS
jgi:predicted transcriptional regulator